MCILKSCDGGRCAQPCDDSDRCCAQRNAFQWPRFPICTPRTPQLPGPYTQRICVPEYWPVNTLETERINHSATMKFTFYAYRRYQSVIFSLNPASNRLRKAKTSRDEIKVQAFQLAEQWQALIGTNGIKSKADLARYLGVSRARVTKVLSRLPL